MKKVLLSLTMAVFAICAFAQESYTLKFNTYHWTDKAGDSGDAIAAGSTAAFTAETASYVSTIVAAANVYPARDRISDSDATACGVKFGSSSKAGLLTITLANPAEVESIVFSAAMYGDSEGGDGFTVSDGDSQEQSFTLSAGNKKFENLTWTPTGTIQTITISQNKASKGRFYLNGITINTKGGAAPDPEPEPEPEPVIDTYEGCEVATFDFTSNGSYDIADKTKLDGTEFTAQDLTAVAVKGTGSTVPTYYANGDAVRLYGGNVFTISTTGKILKVEYTWDTSSSSNPSPTASTSSVTRGYDYTPTSTGNKTETYTWTGSADEVVFKNIMTKGHFRLKSVTVTYESAATVAAKEDFVAELNKASESRSVMAMLKGVNVFQYGPGTIEKYDKKVTELCEELNYTHTDDGVFALISELRQATRTTFPNRAGVNDMFLLQHNSGKYLSISDGVALVDEAEATPVQFHSIALEPEVEFAQATEIGAEVYHSMYIYNTPERKYFGIKRNNFTLTDGQLTQWYIITTPAGYGILYANLNTQESYMLVKDAETGELTLADVEDVKEDQTVAYCWNILNYVAPETPATDPEEGDAEAEATAISSTSTVAAPVAIYSANGARLQSMQKGINIVKMADGTVKKVIK